jgi:hypothetical protein
MGIPFFANHIRELTESFDSKLTEAGIPKFCNLGDTYIYQVLSEVPHVQLKKPDVQQASRSQPYKVAKSTHRAVPNTTRLTWDYQCFS